MKSRGVKRKGGEGKGWTEGGGGQREESKRKKRKQGKEEDGVQPLHMPPYHFRDRLTLSSEN